ncbi:MAG: hypothetical protein VX487_04140 [Actinomycetota bacterium]|nr:hypothetical protein [Acidimicrobiaceae bacterium]MEC7580688.1 hypothetical protein [Actinomycetota bacterium]MAN34175.1 hypothetical protein [Acidimicrobiaceae bacterium]MEC7666214.1 hypothetical protein [Actinomycetota bacterium]MEC8464950.1 hypothetical protein [Actinomycetota bacterium]
MKTRTLLLLSLGCAIVILAAGIGLFVRLGTNDVTAAPSEFGDRVEVGDLQVVVSSASREGLMQRISLKVSGIDDREVTDSFAVISGGVPLNAEPNDCVAVINADTSCEIEFVLSTETSEPAVLIVTRGEERGRWVLAATEDPIP